MKENVILGHLIPAGTGFRMFQDAEASYRREALQELAEAPATLEESFPLLSGGDTPAAPSSAPKSSAPKSSAPKSSESLDSMFGGGKE